MAKTEIETLKVSFSIDPPKAHAITEIKSGRMKNNKISGR
jgi:hypothetical protein